MTESKPRWQRIEEELFPGKIKYLLLAEMRSVLMNNPEFPLDELDKVFRKCGDYEHELIERGILAVIAACENNTRKAELLFTISCSLRADRLEGWVPSLSYVRGVVCGVLSAMSKVSLGGEGGLLKPLAAISCEQDWNYEQRQRVVVTAGDLRYDNCRLVKHAILSLLHEEQQILGLLEHYRDAALANNLSPIGAVIAQVIFVEFAARPSPLNEKLRVLSSLIASPEAGLKIG